MGRKATVVEVSSDSTPGTTYRVWVGEDGPIFCSCPGHKYARHGVRRPCKHMRALSESGDVRSAMTLAAGGAATTRARDRRFRFLEVQEESSEGAWVSVVSLERFGNIEA